MSKKLKMPETDEEWEQYHKALIDFILASWKEKGTVKNEKETREFIDMFGYLLSCYRLKCLLATIIDVDDLTEKFDEAYDWE